MSRGELDENTLTAIQARLPDLDCLLQSVHHYNPTQISIECGPGSTIPLAAPCLIDTMNVTSAARYALHEVFAHLVWYREKRPGGPLEITAVWFGEFYASALASCLYAAGEHLSNAIVDMLEIDRRQLTTCKKKGTSFRRTVVRYLLKQKRNDEVSKTLISLDHFVDWRRAMNYRNTWVHGQPLAIAGMGLVFKRGSRWKEFSAPDGSKGVQLSFGGGDQPDYSVDEVLEFVCSAFFKFVDVLRIVTNCYSTIVSQAGTSAWM